ncbi:uncharacterized protein [Acropora muricata]|uniref:uncharacterized protein n=1 Tax=Acropora muricata TaxID=159855 RepID=UPI0034E577E9
MSEITPKEEMVPIQETVPKDDSLSNRALVKVKQSLHAVKVSQGDATQLQREIEGELFEKWNEGIKVSETKGIPIEKIHGFMDDLAKDCDGIDEETRKDMNKIQWGSEWSQKIVEFKYNTANESGAKYGMVVFVKSKDGKFVDCMYCLYKLHFKVAPEKIITKKEHSALWGLFKWETVEEKVQERVLGVKSLKRIKNFFRFKALQAFNNEGLIDQINVVPSIEDVVDEN